MEPDFFILTPPKLLLTQALLGIRKACDFPIFRIFASWLASITWQKVVMTGHPHLAGKVSVVGLLFFRTSALCGDCQKSKMPHESHRFLCKDVK